jgi:hypothetical protein
VDAPLHNVEPGADGQGCVCVYGLPDLEFFSRGPPLWVRDDVACLDKLLEGVIAK